MKFPVIAFLRLFIKDENLIFVAEDVERWWWWNRFHARQARSFRRMERDRKRFIRRLRR